MAVKIWEIIIDYYMAFFILHVTSTRNIHISPWAEGLRANMGRGLIWHVIWKMPYHNVFIIYRLWTKVFVRFQYSLYISLHNEHFPCLLRDPFWQQQTTEVNKDILITKPDRTKKGEFQGKQNFQKKKDIIIVKKLNSRSHLKLPAAILM